jgi:hypothetical protein
MPRHAHIAPPVATATATPGRRPQQGRRPTLRRTTFRTSRLMDFCSRKELVAQTGHQVDDWPLVAIKELVDNALDACEDARVAPQVDVVVDDIGITVADNGPGIPASTIDGVLDFGSRVSSREAYVAPDRGRQGNALKTIVVMPFVLDGAQGRVDIESHGVRHELVLRVDGIRQTPVIDHVKAKSAVKSGTLVRMRWPDSPSSLLRGAELRFLQIARDYAFLNPHLQLTVDWHGERWTCLRTAPAWEKWTPSDPTLPHWYRPEDAERLVAANVTNAIDNGRPARPVREFVAEFRGLSGSAKQKAVLEGRGSRARAWRTW